MTIAALLFVLMFLNYGLNAISIRMVAQGKYLGTALTDACIAAFGFWMIQEISHAQTLAAFGGYVSGGVCGSLAGLWLTRKR